MHGRVLLYATADVMLCRFAAVEQRHMHTLGDGCTGGVEEMRGCEGAREGGPAGGGGACIYRDKGQGQANSAGSQDAMHGRLHAKKPIL